METHRLVIESMPVGIGDSGKGVFVNKKTMNRAGWNENGVIKISHKGIVAYTKLLSCNGTAVPKNKILMDGFMRRSAGASVGDSVLVTETTAVSADAITLSVNKEISLAGLAAFLAEKCTGRVFFANSTMVISTKYGKKIYLKTTNTTPAGPVIADSHTKFKINSSKKDIEIVSYDDLGGLDAEIRKIREIVEMPLKYPQLFDIVGIDAPKGVLMHGPPGTGKTMLARAVAGETNANFMYVNGPEFDSMWVGESEKKLRNIFQKAQEKAPSIIFFDEIDSVAANRETLDRDHQRRFVSQLLTLMDGIKNRGQVIVIAATNRPNSLDPALRRPGRLERELEISVPNENARHTILNIHTRGMPLHTDVNLTDIARITHGFVGADISSLVKEAGLIAIRRVMPDIDLKKIDLTTKKLNSISITQKDFFDAKKAITPSSMRDVVIHIPNVRWKDVGGMESVKEDLLDAATLSQKHGHLFKKMKVRAPRGILLHGPPGNGKTMIVKALANEIESNFINVKGPELLSKWVGEAENGIRDIFHKARQSSPCIIFFDEIDSLAMKRGMPGAPENIVTQILLEMDGLEESNDVLVIGATNRPEVIDDAIMRPGRFDKKIEVGLPDAPGRKRILKIQSTGKPLAKDVDFELLAKMTDGMSGADLQHITDLITIDAIKRCAKSGNEKDLTLTNDNYLEAIRVQKNSSFTHQV